jgi:hypothetical protein
MEMPRKIRMANAASMPVRGPNARNPRPAAIKRRRRDAQNAAGHEDFRAHQQQAGQYEE